ncbi:XFP N-terminal domain-containing protein [Apiosordaria backusii]|uniref:XFP N-terminal domain-containing protein n=1 Tax=Apiosordaria backusii TaxID=314023 RepID=A0AA40AEK9_9PEZI|nr:XFP N-terminal domain-containing protein [Apiosordaria backusii]
MPPSEIPIPNPPALPSSLPDSILNDLAVQLPHKPLPDADKHSLKAFQRAANYLAASMIFLRDNTLLKSPLSKSDIKPRLLGHWGTCPGLILVYSHLNLLLRNHADLEMIYIIGPGHGAPAALAALWLEGSLERFYPGEYDLSEKGLRNLITRFSLGYALGAAFGAVMDKPDLVVTVVVGDGEAETGPTATAWHAIKFLDPKKSGAVIPVLHVNGFKISERTIFGCMDDKEVVALFSGYGYQVRIVEELERVDEDLQGGLEWALGEIRKIQKAAREGEAVVKPRWPMIVLRTPKGWTGPKVVEGKIIEGSFHSHQVPLPKAGVEDGQLGELREWLESYRIGELIQDGRPTEEVTRILPRENERRLGQNRLTYDPYVELKRVDWREFTVEKGTDQSCMKVTGKFLDKVFQENPESIRLFSPDELESNKLDAILDHTQRNFQWDEYSRANGGRVIEVLSEHDCQAFMQGYTLTGRTAIFPSYESFLGIVHTMMVQYSKFVKIAREVKWRGDLASINYIETSTWARQEHNGFSHQNPSFIGAVLNLKAEAARVYLPPDANCFLSTVHHCLKSKNYTNLIIGSKQPTAVYLSAEEAAEHCKQGASIWHFASSPLEPNEEPDVVLVGIGVEVTFEVVKAAELLRAICPALKVRVVNVTDLMILAPVSRHPHALSKEKFLELFTRDKPVLFNYHGMSVEGYREEGTTTTPFDMMLVNGVSRFNVARWAVEVGVKGEGGKVVGEIEKRVEEVRRFIAENGKDPDDMYEVAKFD